MKIVLATAFPENPAAPRGGVEAVSVVLAGALAALDGAEVHVVTADRGRREVANGRFGDVVVHHLPRSGRPTLLDALGPGRRRVARYIRDLAPDVVHAHDVYGIMVRGLDLPRVFTIHGFIHADTAVSGTRWAALRAILWRHAELRCWAEQPHVVAISPYVRERLAGVARGAIHDIDNPVPESFFAIPRREVPGTVFSAAVISPRKNTLGLVEAFAPIAAHWPQVQLRIAGPVVDAAYAARVRERIAALGLARRVVLLGSIGAIEVRAELAEASAFALVSLEEGAPMGIAEAMAARVPVVASNRCGIPYMVRDGESGTLVDPLDRDDISGALERILDDDALRAAMGACGRRIAEDRFHPAVVARRTREVYTRAIREHAARAEENEAEEVLHVHHA